MARLLFWIVAAGLLVTLAMVLMHPGSMLSPGTLTRAHADLTDDCFACHQPLFGSTSAKCMKCHEPSRIGSVTTRGVPIEAKSVAFHQELLDQDCMACHTDHAGPAPRQALSAFSHEMLRPQTREQCGSCHAKPDDGLHRGLREACHACHSTQAWMPATFDHARYFELDRDHDADCSICHIDNAYEAYSCYGCHEHTRTGIRAEHLEEGIRDFEDCVECHRSADKPEDHGRRTGRIDEVQDSGETGHE
jgi:hypothetical protein